MANSYSISLVCKMWFLCFYAGTISKAASVVPIWFIFPGEVFGSAVCSAFWNGTGVLLGSSDGLANRLETSCDVSALEWHFCMYFRKLSCQRKCGLNIVKLFLVISQISTIVFLTDGCVKSRTPSWFVNSYQFVYLHVIWKSLVTC